MDHKDYQKLADKRDKKLISISVGKDLPVDLLTALTENYQTDKEVIDKLAGSTIL